ncbi:DUF6932 family protein [Rhodopirellula bahusiensis]|uniref:DUF6932 family protein n=1 Tax=Rhodopirellula bahusiensis TaxID=2014065 RepID=UPI0036F2DBCB
MNDKKDYPALFKPGLHRKTLSQLRHITVDKFPESHRRRSIFAAVCEIHRTLTHHGIPCRMFIDGSFSTEKQEPGDADIVCEFRNDDITTLPLNARQVLQWACAGEHHLDDRCHLFGYVTYPKSHALHQLSRGYQDYWMDFFSHGRDRSPKGLPFIEVSNRSTIQSRGTGAALTSHPRLVSTFPRSWRAT